MVLASHVRARPARRGAIAGPWLVLYLLVLFVLLYVVQQIAWRSHLRAELQRAEDAAAHAAAATLVTESVFAHPYVGSTSLVDINRKMLIDDARTAGEKIGKRNFSRGLPFVLRPNPQNLTDRGLFVGTLENPASRTFIGLDRLHFDPFDPDLNAVRVVSQRYKVAESSTYFIDRDVLGFRVKQPLAASPLFHAIPMVPIAIRSNPCQPLQNNCWLNGGNGGGNTWENEILARHGDDNWRIDPTSGVPTAGSDGIPEITITLTEGDAAGDNARLVYFDGTAQSFAALRAQVTRGVVYADLPANNGQAQGQFLLNANGSTAPNSNVAMPATQPMPGGGAAKLKARLQGILGQPRVWMLYSFVQDQNHNPTFAVVGFVVARVMRAVSADGQVSAVLQPSVLITDTAVTDYTLRDLGPRTLYNPYVARVRLVE
jgi:hypothetical protein